MKCNTTPGPSRRSKFQRRGRCAEFPGAAPANMILTYLTALSQLRLKYLFKKLPDVILLPRILPAPLTRPANSIITNAKKATSMPPIPSHKPCRAYASQKAQSYNRSAKMALS
ncbi:hypothetical protein HZ326_0381 [Fusarium oxysporum f. sp. albedinis]|nr:hypothetical protein HZ326_0381 [Fusarium oxysporum f. sp. albedinis]